MTSRAAWIVVAVVLVIATIGAVAVTVATRWGIGLSSDSITYLRMADLFERGHGIVDAGDGRQLASPHFPPLYPLALSALTFGDERAVVTARWLNVALIGVNVALVALLAWRATGQRGCAIAAAALAASSVALLGVHASAWSEPLFLTFTIIALLLLARSITNGSQLLLLLAASATGAACLTRYAGMALIAACVFAIVWQENGALRRRVFYAALFSIVAATPLMLWLMRNVLLFDTAVNRDVRLHGFDVEHVRMIVVTLQQWLLPLPIELSTAAAAGAGAVAPIVIAMLALAVRTRRKPAGGPPEAITLRRLLGVFVACYVALVLLTVSLLDPLTPLDIRILSPVQVALIVWVAYAAARLAIRPWIVATACVLFVGMNVYGSTVWVSRAAEGGMGLVSRRWARSQVLRFAGNIAPETEIHTNMPELFEAHYQRRATRLPRPFNISTDEPIADYEANLQALAESLRRTGGVVVWFRNVPRDAQYESEAVVVKKLDLRRIKKARDGAIYRANQWPTTAPASPS